MYTVRNVSNGTLCLCLEKGSIMLQPGKSFDLDGICSRKWIRLNHDIKRLITCGMLAVLLDSEQRIPEQPIKDIVNMALSKKQNKEFDFTGTSTIIIDLSQFEEKEDQELQLEESKKEEKVTKPSEKIAEIAPIQVSENVEVTNSTSKKDENPIDSSLICTKCGRVCATSHGLKVHYSTHVNVIHEGIA